MIFMYALSLVIMTGLGLMLISALYSFYVMSKEILGLFRSIELSQPVINRVNLAMLKHPRTVKTLMTLLF